jgi:Mlc titration factor MtfA (ptsG expression regulator)
MKIESVEKLAHVLIQKHLSVEAIRAFYEKNSFRPFFIYEDEEIVDYLTEDWKFEITDSRQIIAETDYDTATITMSSVFIKNVKKADVYDALMHEIAHALCPKVGHNWMWESICRHLGQYPSEFILWNFPKERRKKMI